MAKMYIGPTIAVIGLKGNTIVRGTNPVLPQLQSLITTNPLVSSLYVDPIHVGAARQRMQLQGTLEYEAAKAVVAYGKTVTK